ncbi:MAG: hypothetical protein ABMA25_12205 [Ilumatobacteraceae bacterium]
MRSQGSTRFRAGKFRAATPFVNATVLADRAELRLRVLPLFGKAVRNKPPLEILFADVQHVWTHGRSATIARTDASRLPPVTVARWLGEAIAAAAGVSIGKSSRRRCRQFVKHWRPPAR